MTADEIKNKYEKRIEAYLQTIIDALREYELEVSDVSLETWSDDYQWWVFTHPVGRVRSDGAWVDICFTIAESEHWDGEENGINFMVEINSASGRQIGGVIPYNFTNEVWVSRDDEEAIDERFCFVERIDPLSAADLIIEHYAKER